MKIFIILKEIILNQKNLMIDAIILVGGLGTRLRKTIPNIPKPLAPINGVPFLDILIKLLKKNNVNNIILAVGYKSQEFIKKYSNFENIIISEEKKLLGTGGAVKQAMQFVKSEKVLVLNGDSYIDFSLENLLNYSRQKNADGVILCKTIIQNDRFGLININNENKILSFDEKKFVKKGLINVGVYLLKKNIFSIAVFSKIFSLEKDFFPKLIKNKNIFSLISTNPFIDIGTKDSFLLAQEKLKALSKKN
ncbi:MAG: D-glycero-alpha-D-manno-heptose 1-phosphate guanylyltransferase [Candidatus Anoxychlamydiales bacterium]|nr:D-glycero-alpha-D-manno-heptose 1-phosphate guanylyltransferase [Candidatus Anoxychlamydiales bacterium]